MIDLQEFYILGLPIDTDLGECEFLLVREYPDYFSDLQLMALTKEHIVNKYNEINKDGSIKEFIDELQKLTLYDIATSIPELSEAYSKLFMRVFNSDEILQKIDEKNFDYYRKLIMTMNCMKEEKINPNPEIQKAIERSRRVKQSDGESIDFTDIVTSCVGYNGLLYKDINDFTIYQLYMTYYRIAQFKNYDTSTLFATVSSDKINIESWGKHINLFEEEKHFVTKEEFSEKSNGLFSGS